MRTLRTSAPALLLSLLAACGATAQPAPDRLPHTADDVAFMRHMIVHHAQAVEMTALVPERTPTPQLHLLAERIAVSQEDEMAWMRRWLARHGESAPDAHALHHGDHAGMPGMATPEEMARLRDARGADFDGIFLELMIRHHEGALVMVAELFASDRGGQSPEVFGFASEVDADQRMEIRRMRTLQAAPNAGAPPR